MKHVPNFTRDNSLPLEHREAPSTFDRATGTVEATFATGADVRRRDARGEFIERLLATGANLEALRGASVLDSHMQGGIGSVIGTVDTVRVEGGTIIGRIRFSQRPEVAPLIKDVEASVVRFVSVGYTVEEYAESTDPATGLRVRTAVKWTPREVSFVPVPADPAARTRQQADPPFTGRAAINREIRTLATQGGMSQRAIDDLIDREATLDAARAAIMSDMMIRSQAQHIRSAVGTDYTSPTMQAQAIGDALYAKMTGTPPSGPARELVHRSTLDLMAHHLRINGVPVHSESPNEIVAGKRRNPVGHDG